MTITDQFVLISNLICESSRARILWNLLDGRAYTATELAYAADISPTTCSNHLAKLLEGKILKVETQGRHRYYNFYSEEVANVVESLATLAQEKTEDKSSIPNGVKYCRTCYDHLAGYIGVQLTNTLETKGY
ncbi:MAG: ArsR/SmtB family transcription factor, partial [Flavobacterium sp.]